MTTPGPVPATEQSGSNVHGGIWMSLAMLCFVCNDAAVKTLAGTLNVGQLIAVRGFCACLIIAVLVVATGKAKHLNKAAGRPVIIRTLFDVASTFLFIIALFNMALPNITAILQAVPLVVTVMAAIFLHEAVGWQRMGAIALGFAGVLLIVKPGGAEFNIYALLAVACVFTVATRDLLTRKMDRGTPSIIVAFTNAIGVTLGGVVWMAFDGFEPMQVWQVLRILLASVFLVGGYLFTVMALRDTDVSHTAAFRYTLIVYALVLGYVVFGDVPDLLATIGIVLIVAAGLFTLYRERQLKKRVGFGRRPVR